MIYGFDDRIRLQRQGKIRIGQKIQQETRDGKVIERPVALDYFVGPPEVHQVYGPKPRKLHILIPSEDMNEVFDTSLRWYGRTGLKCIGDGRVASRYDEERQEWVPMTCPYQECPIYQAGHCTEVGSFRFILPRVPGGALSVYQLDTGSYNSTLNIKATLVLLKKMLGRISLIPLILEVRMEEKTPIDPATGKRIVSKVPVLYLTTEFTFEELLEAARRNRLIQQVNLADDRPQLEMPPLDMTKPEELYPADMNGGALDGGEAPVDRMPVAEVEAAAADEAPAQAQDMDALEAELHRLWDLLGTTQAKRRLELSKPGVDLAKLLATLQAEVKRRGLDPGKYDVTADSTSGVTPEVNSETSNAATNGRAGEDAKEAKAGDASEASGDAKPSKKSAKSTSRQASFF